MTLKCDLEFRDAVLRACQASEERYRAELERERESHNRVRDALPPDAMGDVTFKCDLDLRVRENELMRDRVLKGHEINSLCASGQQLVTQFHCALREIDLRRAGSSPTQVTADSHLPVDPSITYEVVESGSCREVISCTETTSAVAAAPATNAGPHTIPITRLACRTHTATSTVTQDSVPDSPPRVPPRTERFTGTGNRLGKGGGDDDDDDDGRKPGGW